MRNTPWLVKMGCAAVVFCMGLGILPRAEAQRIVIDGQGIQVEANTGGTILFHRPSPGPEVVPGAHFRLDEAGNILSAAGYRCTAATAASDSPIICRSLLDRYETVIYWRDPQSNTFYVDHGDSRSPRVFFSGSGLRVLPSSGRGTPSGSGLRIIGN